MLAETDILAAAPNQVTASEVAAPEIDIEAAQIEEAASGIFYS